VYVAYNKPRKCLPSSFTHRCLPARASTKSPVYTRALVPARDAVSYLEYFLPDNQAQQLEAYPLIATQGPLFFTRPNSHYKFTGAGQMVVRSLTLIFRQTDKVSLHDATSNNFLIILL